MNFSKLIHWKLFVAAGFAGFQLDILTLGKTRIMYKHSD